MNPSIDIIPQFLHKAPKGYSYEVNEFKRGIFAIWLCCSHHFNYNGGKPSKSIWGFYNYKECKFYSPVNSKTVGEQVQFKNTRDYSAMPIKQYPLDKFFR